MDKKEVLVKLRDNNDLFSKVDDDMKCMSLVQHHINTGDAAPMVLQKDRPNM